MLRRTACLATITVGVVMCAFIVTTLYYGYGDLEFTRINQGQNRLILARQAGVLGLGLVLVFLGLTFLKRSKR